MTGNKFMKKNKNIPLNLREQMNSRIGLICSVILLLLLVAGLRQLDYNLIEKPKEEAAKVNPGLPVDVIDMKDYGMMNGEAVYKKAKAMMGE